MKSLNNLIFIFLIKPKFKINIKKFKKNLKPIKILFLIKNVKIK